MDMQVVAHHGIRIGGAPVQRFLALINEVKTNPRQIGPMLSTTINITRILRGEK